ncbi:YEATS domain-containing protein 4-like, partial [Daphnia pulex]|uniref:YEATS domain-containing protein 4-like n=1 Tax=Daphnia pulex TaxID=6669 RepID=UPI001EE14C2D
IGLISLLFYEVVFILLNWQHCISCLLNKCQNLFESHNQILLNILHKFFVLFKEKLTQMSNFEYGPDSGGRTKGVILKPVVYGNVAKYFGKKREEDGHTHQWTVYVRPFENEDMSTYVKKINFKLHDSYANQNRVLTKPPYEVTETGWGEFEIVIKIYFQDPNERPVTFYHILKLFQNSPEIVVGKKPVVSEFYEEIVFQEPTVMMHQLLTNIPQLSTSPVKHDADFEEKKVSTLDSIVKAKAKVKNELSELKDRLQLAKETIQKFRDEVQNLQLGNPASTPT